MHGWHQKSYELTRFLKLVMCGGRCSMPMLNSNVSTCCKCCTKALEFCYQFVKSSTMYPNKKFKKLKTALFYLFLSQKHYVIFSNNVWRVNITRKHYGLHDSKLADNLDCRRFGFAFFAQHFSVICNRRKRRGLFIDLSDKYKFTQVKRVFGEG